MLEDIQQFVDNCRVCLRAKPSRLKKQGHLQPLPVPNQPFQHVALDFITPLPIYTRDGIRYNSILVVIDRLSKYRKFIPMSSISAQATADAFRRHIWSEWGFPLTVVSNRGT